MDEVTATLEQYLPIVSGLFLRVYLSCGLSKNVTLGSKSWIHSGIGDFFTGIIFQKNSEGKDNEISILNKKVLKIFQKKF
jgi:hypothetical protein